MNMFIIVLVALNTVLPWQSGAQWQAGSDSVLASLRGAGVPEQRVRYIVAPSAFECNVVAQRATGALWECSDGLRAAYPEADLVLAVSRGDLLGMFMPEPSDKTGSGVLHRRGVAFANLWGFQNETCRVCSHEVGHAFGLADGSGAVMSMADNAYMAGQLAAIELTLGE